MSAPETGNAIAVDADGYAYIAGATSSPNFPITNAPQRSLRGSEDAFVLKLATSGKALVYSTYVGGSSVDIATALTLDSANRAYVGGYTASTDFPAANAVQTMNKGGYDAFLVRLNAMGSALEMGTYLGGSDSDSVYGIAVDSGGIIYVAGQTLSTDFPIAAAGQWYKLSAESAFAAAVPTTSNRTNLALGAATDQSSTLYGADSSRAVDGNTDGNYWGGSVTHTNLETNAWWQLDLGRSARIDSLVIWNRTDACGDRLSIFWVFLSDTPFAATDTPATLQGRAGTWSSFQAASPSPSVTIAVGGFQGRYVRIQLGGNYLSLSEVQVYGASLSTPGTNLAINGTASQSSSLYGGDPTKAIDGNTDGYWTHSSVTHTNMDGNPWWQVDLGRSAAIHSIVVWNRTDCCGDRLRNFWVFVSNTPFSGADTPATLQGRPGIWSSFQALSPNPSDTISVGGVQGRYVRIQLLNPDYLSLAEVQIMGTWFSNLATGKVATQSSTLFGASASKAVDGSTDGAFYDGSVTHTSLDPNPWWQVDLGQTVTISSVIIWNRTDGCMTRLSNYWVFVSNMPFVDTDTPATLRNRPSTWSSYQVAAPDPASILEVGGIQARYVRIQLSTSDYLSLAEVQVVQ